MVVLRTGETPTQLPTPTPLSDSRTPASQPATVCTVAGTRRRDAFASRTPRPDPQSQSFSRSYGSILPTSLIYILLLTRGCTPWRPDAVMSTPGGANKARYSNFQGSSGAHRTGPKRTCFPSHSALSPGKPIPGPLTVNKKRQLFPGLPPTVFEPACVAAYPLPGHGILTVFPFDSRGDPRIARLPNGVSLSLRSGSLTSNCCSRQTFLHFSLQSSHLNICYYHQDLH